MSSKYTNTRKELAGLVGVSAKNAFVKNSKGEYKLRKDMEIVGKVDIRVMPNMILYPRKDSKLKYVDDTVSLPKRVKQEMLEYFYDSNGRPTGLKVLYLARTDKKSKTSKENVEKYKNK
ncbi:MAG: hypothetical protein LBU60_05175 [Clostridiales bacterium]|jgi:hypothetical protein|nr:hypothetical protein [Clostridiales bacterium]